MRRRIGGFSVDELARGLVVCDPITAIGTAISWIAGKIVDIATSVGAALAAMWHVISPIFGHVWGALRPIWDHVLKPFWGKLTAWIDRFKGWWTTWAKPVTDFLARVEHFERAICAATFGPILDTISNLQKLLAVLHLQHTAIGRALAGALNQVYADLTNTWRHLVDPINRIIARIEGYILDVNGWLHVNLLIGSMAVNFDRIWNLWWTKSLPALSREGRQLLDDPRAKKTIQQHHDDAKNWLTQRSGDLADAVAHGKTVFAAVVQRQEPPESTP